MTCAWRDWIPIAKKWDSPIYRDVSRIATFRISGFDDPETRFCRLAGCLNECRCRSAQP